MSARPPVLIIGAHRSGTTATAHALELLGLQIGQHLDSHRESHGMQRLHEDYLRRVGARWFEPASFLDSLETHQGLRDCVDYFRQNLRENFGRIFGYRNNVEGFWGRARLKFGVPWGWKEPRTTLFAPAWLEIFPNARVIHIIRNPVAVAASIRRRELEFRAAGDPPNAGLDDLDYCVRLALAYVEAGERLARKTPHYRLVRFEEIQAAPQKRLKELADFCDVSPAHAQLGEAALTIEPASPSLPPGPTEAAAQELLNRYPRVAELGYSGTAP